jgi:hypothetical protein
MKRIEGGMRTSATTVSAMMLSIALALFAVLSVYDLSNEYSTGLNGYYKDTRSGIYVREAINASNHLYPYVATVITCGCILVVIMVIILFGADL